MTTSISAAAANADSSIPVTFTVDTNVVTMTESIVDTDLGPVIQHEGAVSGQYACWGSILGDPVTDAMRTAARTRSMADLLVPHFSAAAALPGGWK